MNNTFEQSKMRFKLPVRILSGVALLCAFFYGFFNFGIYVNTVIIESRFYFWILLDAILSIIPYALLLAFYLFFYCRKEQKAFLILILVLKLFVVPVFSSCISDIFMLRNPLELFFAYVVAQLILWSIPFILLLISVIRNFSNRLLFIIPIFLIIVVLYHLKKYIARDSVGGWRIVHRKFIACPGFLPISPAGCGMLTLHQPPS